MSAKPATHVASVQATALVLAALAGLIAGLAHGSAPMWALFGYLGAWLLLHISALRFSRAALVFLGVAGMIGTSIGAERLVAGGYGETWGGTAAHMEDQRRLQRLPAIAPSVVFGDHPQTFYLATSDDTRGDEVRVRLGPRGATLDALALGHGLFRVDYDPRIHGRVAGADGPIDARVFLGETSATRTLQYVSPLAHPRALCTSPDRSLAATPSLESDQLFTVDADGRVRAFDVGDGPADCAFLDDERVLVGHRFGPTSWVLGTDGQVLRRIASPPVRRVAVMGGLVALAHAESVSILSAATLELQSALDVADVDWLGFTDEGTLILARRRAAELLRFRRGSDGREWTRDASLALGRPAVTMVRLDESHVVVSATDYVPSGEPHLGNHFVQDQLLTVDTELMRVVGQELTARRSPRQSNAGDVDRGLSPIGLHVDGESLHVAFAGSDETWLVHPGALPDMRFTEDIPAPEGIALLRDAAGESLVVTSPSAGLIATNRSGAIGDEWRVVALHDGDEDSPRRRGQRAFYEGTRAGISCQSCHLHGDTDFVLRNIGGQRLAPTLGVGGIADTAPFLRDGSYPRIRDLDHLASTLFRGYLRRDATRGLDIEAYIRALPRRPVRVQADEHDGARERRGLDVFARAECATCHSFPAFTNLAQLPAGGLFPELSGEDEVLDTPSLLSVGTHSPYLSDGRAEDLRAIFADHNPANRHGDTAGLSEAELDDLVYFLERL